MSCNQRTNHLSPLLILTILQFMVSCSNVMRTPVCNFKVIGTHPSFHVFCSRTYFERRKLFKNNYDCFYKLGTHWFPGTSSEITLLTGCQSDFKTTNFLNTFRSLLILLAARVFRTLLFEFETPKMWSRFLTGTLQRKPRKIEDSTESQSLPTTPVAHQRGLRRLDAWIGSLLRDGKFEYFLAFNICFVYKVSRISRRCCLECGQYARNFRKGVDLNRIMGIDEAGLTGNSGRVGHT